MHTKQDGPEEAAKIQIEGGYVSGDAETNAGIIKGLDFNPGVEAARDTFASAFTDLQATGDLNASLDEKEFEEKAFPVLEGGRKLQLMMWRQASLHRHFNRIW